MAGQQASNYHPTALASHVDELTDELYWGPTTFSGSPNNTMSAQYMPQNSTPMSNSFEVTQHSIYPLNGLHSASGSLNVPLQVHQLAPSSSHTQPGYLSSTNVSEIPVAFDDRLFNLFQAYKEIDPNEHPCMQQIHDFARRTGETPSVVDYFFHSMREALKLHISAQYGLKTPELTQELPDRHSPAGIGAVLQSRPTNFEVPKGKVGGTTRRGRGVRDFRRKPTNKPRSPMRKRPRIVDTGPVSESNLIHPSAKRQLISQAKELAVKGPPKVWDRFECVSCNKSFKKWSDYTNHETKCHFPYRLFKCNQCEHQCAKIASGRIHLEMARKHIKYTEKSELDNVFESCCVDATHIFHDACGFCEATFTTREASCDHIRKHIKERCKRSEWTHRCKTAHPFCHEPAKVVAVMLATTDHQNDQDDDERGNDGNGDADSSLDGNNTGGEADDAPGDDDGNEDDDEDDGDANGGATGSSATDETAPVHEDEGSKDANPGDKWIDNCNNNLLRNSLYICHICQSQAKPQPTRLYSRMHGQHGSQRVIPPATDPRHHFGRTKQEKGCFRHGRIFKVEVNSQYLSHIPKRDSSPKSVSSVISFRCVRTLGQGAFGTVDEVENPRFPGKTFALKTFEKSSPSWSAEEAFSREREALASLWPGHPHLIEFLGSNASGSQFCILMSPVANMDLARLLHSRHWSIERYESSWSSRPSISSQMKTPLEKRAKSLLNSMGCLASALRHIHNVQPNGMTGYHCDLKPENVLVFEVQNRYHLRVADFGSASFSATTYKRNSKALAVTPMYSAPEFHTHNSQRRQLDRADIWSLGCVFLDMLTWAFGIPIEEFENFRSSDPSDRAFYSKQHQVKLWLAKLQERAQQLGYSFSYLNPYGTIWNMISNSPEDRPTAKQLESAFPANSCCGVPSNESGVGPQSQSKTLHLIRLLKSINAIEKLADTSFDRETSSYILPFWGQGRWKEAEVTKTKIRELSGETGLNEFEVSFWFAGQREIRRDSTANGLMTPEITSPNAAQAYQINTTCQQRPTSVHNHRSRKRQRQVGSLQNTTSTMVPANPQKRSRRRYDEDTGEGQHLCPSCPSNLQDMAVRKGDFVLRTGKLMERLLVPGRVRYFSGLALYRLKLKLYEAIATLWHEPAGSTGTAITNFTTGQYDGQKYCTVRRRFVVRFLPESSGSSWCWQVYPTPTVPI
jgi:serine/threonine protein kinase